MSTTHLPVVYIHRAHSPLLARLLVVLRTHTEQQHRQTCNFCSFSVWYLAIRSRAGWSRVVIPELYARVEDAEFSLSHSFTRSLNGLLHFPYTNRIWTCGSFYSLSMVVINERALLRLLPVRKTRVLVWWVASTVLRLFDFVSRMYATGVHPTQAHTCPSDTLEIHFFIHSVWYRDSERSAFVCWWLVFFELLRWRYVWPSSNFGY